jgi:hypothetical protein
VGLTELFGRRDERVFVSLERIYRKWLAHPLLTDETIRSQIRFDLSDLYDGWTISRIYRLRLGAAMAIARRHRTLGVGWPGIIQRIAFRASRRLRRSLRPGSRS